MTGMLLAGPWLGGWLYEHFDALAFLWVAASFAGIAFWGRKLWDQEQKLGNRKEHSNNLRALFHEPVLRVCCLIEGLSSATSSLFATFILVLCVEQLRWTQTQAVKLMAAQGLVTVLCLFLLSPKFSRLAPQRIYTFALAAACIALCLLGWLESFTGLALVALLMSTASSAIHLANMGRLTTLSLDKGGVSGLFSLAQTLGMFCGSLFGGILSHWLDMRQLFPVWSVVVLFGSGLIYILSQNKSK